MNLKMKRIVALALTLVMLSAFWIPANATVTYSEPPEGFEGVDSVALEVDSGLAWHEMTETEATQFELSGHTGPIYVAGNSGKAEKSASNVAIKVTKPGVLTFEYALSADPSIFNSYDYFGCRINGVPIDVNVDSADCDLIAQGDNRPLDNSSWSSRTITVNEGDLGDNGEAIIYIAYTHSNYTGSDTHLNYAAIRNVKYSTGAREDVVRFESGDETMGSVTAELQVITITQDDKGNDVQTITYEPADIYKMKVGNIYRLKAVANSGYQFYGWIRHYKNNNRDYEDFVPYDNAGMVMTVDDTTYYTPVFAAEGTYYIRNGADFYTTETPIDKILSSSTIMGTVVLLDDYEIPASVNELTVPAGITLYIPYRDFWGKAESEASYHQNIDYGTSTISGMDKAFVTLTIPENTTVTFNGNLILGAQRSSSNNYHLQGHISGAFGHIVNNGSIILNNGADLTCYGLITGNGTLLAKDGSSVKESLIISDYSGGNNSMQLFNQDQMPFLRYAAQNVQCTLQMEAKASLSAMAVLYALGGHNEVDVKLLGSGDDVVFRTAVTADNTVILERTYDGSTQVTSGQGNNTAGIGISNWKISGGLTFQTLTISLADVIFINTSRAVFPLPYNMHLELNSGTYYISSGVMLLPGSKLTVNKGATLDLTSKLYVLDGLVQSTMSGDRYPARADLENAGLRGYGEFILNGKLDVHAGATLGGVIQSTQAGAVLNVEEGVYLDNRTADLTKLNPTIGRFIKQPPELFDKWADVTLSSGAVTSVKNWVLQLGGAGYYDDNTVWMNNPARIWNGTELAYLTPGMYLSGAATENTIGDSYQGIYVPEIANWTESGGLKYNTTDGQRCMNVANDPFERTVHGTWAIPSEELEITVNAGAGSTKAGSLTNGVEITTAYVTNEDNTITLTITPKKDGVAVTTKFVYLITCLMDDSTTQTVSAKSDGVATLPAGTINVTIDWCALGDLTGDGIINNRDLIRLRKCLVDKSVVDELGLLAADITEDGLWNNKDLIRYRKNYI